LPNQRVVRFARKEADVARHDLRAAWRVVIVRKRIAHVPLQTGEDHRFVPARKQRGEFIPFDHAKFSLQSKVKERRRKMAALCVRKSHFMRRMMRLASA
jgi:hypothetical protein